MTQADPAPITPALSTADLNTTINHEPRVLDVRLAEALGYKRAADIRPLVERHKEALERLGGIIRTMRKNQGRGRLASENWLTKKQALYLCTKSETDRATEITIQIVEVFDAHTARRSAPPPVETPALSPPTSERRQPRLVDLFACACSAVHDWKEAGIVADQDRALWIAFQAVLDVAGVEAPISHMADLRRRR